MSADSRTHSVKLRERAAAWREVDGEIILLGLESSTYLGVNGAGSTLWPLMVEGTTSESMANRLVERYGIDRTRADGDVAAFVEACRTRGLLEP
ncbi:PqqD family protein [Blastococcus saxobsidens]|uniref:Coenzyme PQQ synthesis protein D (PqqD) n=1 Tax=Blastococcus saxobsidens (strain DD2) TaxID=1146883 RepID=H6RMY9_BLASD|nr:PqqD family protein [Blastococcus saxobsidens]CCG01342.1 conserved hypotetical protein of unknown function [Blastococcus saxobsidens DD2]